MNVELRLAGGVFSGGIRDSETEREPGGDGSHASQCRYFDSYSARETIDEWRRLPSGDSSQDSEASPCTVRRVRTVHCTAGEVVPVSTRSGFRRRRFRSPQNGILRNTAHSVRTAAYVTAESLCHGKGRLQGHAPTVEHPAIGTERGMSAKLQLIDFKADRRHKCSLLISSKERQSGLMFGPCRHLFQSLPFGNDGRQPHRQIVGKELRLLAQFFDQTGCCLRGHSFAEWIVIC